MSHAAVLLQHRGAVATLVLNRPERLNAMNRALIQGVLGHLERLAEDPGVRVVVITGAGRAFSAGGDRFATPEETVVHTGTFAGDVRSLRAVMRSAELLREMPAVTIAAVNGACAGAALSWACAADLRYAADTARFATAFLPAALSGDFGGTWTLPRLVGPAKARELYLLGETVDAAEAHRIGLVTAVVPTDDLMSTVDAAADRLCAYSAAATSLVKRNLNAADTSTFAEALDLEADGIARCLRTGDAAAADEQFRHRPRPNDNPAQGAP
jgi:2-(1,2-epoxy-1,2-dihydrophenyl)acetyl-CoA isomerase